MQIYEESDSRGLQKGAFRVSKNNIENRRNNFKRENVPESVVMVPRRGGEKKDDRANKFYDQVRLQI